MPATGWPGELRLFYPALCAGISRSGAAFAHSDCRLVTLIATSPNFCLSQKFGGAEEDRTPDPLLAKQVLSQLSYSPPVSSRIAELQIPNFKNQIPKLGFAARDLEIAKFASANFDGGPRRTRTFDPSLIRAVL